MRNVIKNILRYLFSQIILDRLAYFLKYYLVIRRKLKYQLRQKKNEDFKPYKGKKVLVPLIETNHYQYLHILGIAKILQLRGADVLILVCGGILEACEIKSVRNASDNDPCWTCRFNVKHTLNLFELNSINLADIVSVGRRIEIQSEAEKIYKSDSDIISHEINYSKAIDESVIRYYYGAIPKDKKEEENVRVKNINTILLSSEAVLKIDDTFRPDIVLASMSCYSPFEPFYKYYTANGNRFRQISMNPFDFKKITFNSLDLYKPWRYLKWLENRNYELLTFGEKSVLDEFLNIRFNGKSEIFIKEGYFGGEITTNLASLFIKKDGVRNVFLFSNIYYDVGLSDAGILYPDVISWVLNTINLVNEESGVKLFIKPHPGEIFDSSSSMKTISQIIKEHYIELPENVVIIEPEWKINTYDLFKYIDVGIIFTGTLGLEMLISNIPVISAGATVFYGLGFAAEPQSETQYLNLILGYEEPPIFDRMDLMRFAYFYFIKSSMPWTLTQQSYADAFNNGFAFENIAQKSIGNDLILDHLCACIMSLDNTVVDAWPDSHYFSN